MNTSLLILIIVTLTLVLGDVKTSDKLQNYIKNYNDIFINNIFKKKLTSHNNNEILNNAPTSFYLVHKEPDVRTRQYIRKKRDNELDDVKGDKEFPEPSVEQYRNMNSMHDLNLDKDENANDFKNLIDYIIDDQEYDDFDGDYDGGDNVKPIYITRGRLPNVIRSNIEGSNAAPTMAEENLQKPMTKRIFTIWTRHQGFPAASKEIHHRRHFYNYFNGDIVSAETRASLGRPPGSPLRWG